MTTTKTQVCGSRGPRIGEVAPRCAQEFGHPGSHRGFIDSGYENTFWGEPIMRDVQFVEDWAAAGRAPDPHAKEND